MMKRKAAALFLLLLLLANLSCAGRDAEVEQPYPPTRGDSEKLAEALASRKHEDPPPLTLLQAYQIAQEAATEWNENSFLGSMGTSMTYELPHIFYFHIYNPNAGSGCERRRSDMETLRVGVDRISGAITEKSSNSVLPGGGGIDPNTWLIDSPEALEIADALGGTGFRENHPHCGVGIGVDWIRKKWEINYREIVTNGEPGAWLQILVDPYTGEATMTEESAEKAI